MASEYRQGKVTAGAVLSQASALASKVTVDAVYRTSQLDVMRGYVARTEYMKAHTPEGAEQVPEDVSDAKPNTIASWIKDAAPEVLDGLTFTSARQGLDLCANLARLPKPVTFDTEGDWSTFASLFFGFADVCAASVKKDKNDELVPVDDADKLALAKCSAPGMYKLQAQQFRTFVSRSAVKVDKDGKPVVGEFIDAEGIARDARQGDKTLARVSFDAKKSAAKSAAASKSVALDSVRSAQALGFIGKSEKKGVKVKNVERLSDADLQALVTLCAVIIEERKSAEADA